MNMNHYMRHSISDQVSDLSKRNNNNLGIRKIDRIYDKYRDQLILMVNTREMLGREVNAFLKGNDLIMEAPFQLDYNKPYRRHLIGKDILYESEIDVSLIGFARIKLKPGYHYTVLSCQLINPNLVKIILHSRISFINPNEYKNHKE